MAFNINDFKSTMNRYGGNARTSLFEVEIAGVSVQGVIPTRDLRFFCQNVSVPGVNLETTYYKPTGIGLSESIPMSIQPEALNCVFMLDSNHNVMTFFHRWISSVMNISGRLGDNSNGLPGHQIDYKDNYKASALTVRHYSTSNPFSAYEFNYFDVYPTQVSNLDLSWASKDVIATITVNFSYSRMEHSGFSNRAFENSQAFAGFQQSIVRGGRVPQTLLDNNAPQFS